MKFLRTLLILGRVSNLPTVWTNVVAGWLVGRGIFGLEIGWLLGGVSLLYWAGMTLNDAFDSGWDRKNAPERPIPSGAISRSATWIIGALQMAGGVGLLLWKTGSPPSILLMLVGAILVYDWIHKKWKGSVLIMGLCRALVYLLAWSAARENMQLSPTSPLVYLLGFGVLLYISGLTLVARSERDRTPKGLAALPRILLLVPTAFPILVMYCEPSLDFNRILLYSGIIVSSIWIVYFRSILNAGQIPRGIGYAIAGLALYDTTVALLLDWKAGVFCLVCFGLTLAAQRVIPAT